MRGSSLIFATAAILLGNASAAPTTKAPLDTFYLVSTSEMKPDCEPANLDNVWAISLFDPDYEANYVLRQIGADYGSLPKFQLIDGTLHTWAQGPHGVSVFQYNSTMPVVKEELQFARAVQSGGNLGLLDGYLLVVDGIKYGWTVCDGAFGEQVVRLLRSPKSLNTSN